MQHTLPTPVPFWRRLWDRLTDALWPAELPDLHETAERLSVDRRCLPSRAFDGCPRRRHDDVSLLLVELDGSGCAWKTRDGTRAEIERFDWLDQATPVHGFVVIEKHAGMVVRLAAQWSHLGAYQGRGRRHPWDLVSVETARCRECGCDDLHACVHDDGSPCGWLEVDYAAGEGLCSACLERELTRQMAAGAC